MKYVLNTDVFQSTFGVPSKIADNYIKLASHPSLKVILFIMRNGTKAVDADTPFKLGITQVQLDEALLYWEQAGILTEPGANQAVDVTDKKPQSVIIKDSRPNRAEVVRRVAESKEIAQVLRQAEQIFGRILKQNEMAALVYVMDELALSPAVTLMLIQYASQQDKISASFMESTAVRWVNEGICTVREAEKEIQLAQSRKTAWGMVCSAMGIDRRRPSKKEEEASLKWVCEWGFSQQMLRLAYDQCVDHSGKFAVAYIDRILENWHNSGITDPEKAAKAATERAEKKGQAEKPSFDIDLFEQMLNGEE